MFTCGSSKLKCKHSGCHRLHYLMWWFNQLKKFLKRNIIVWYCWIHELRRIRWKDSECNNTFRIWQFMLKAYDVLWCLGVGLGFSILWADSQLMLARVCVWSQHCWHSISSPTWNGTRTSPLLSTMLSAASATSHPYWELSLLTPGSENTSETLSCKCTKVWIQANNKNTLCKLCSCYVDTF